MSTGRLWVSMVLGVTLASALVLALYATESFAGTAPSRGAPQYDESISKNVTVSTAPPPSERALADVAGLQSQTLTAVPSHPALSWPIVLALLLAAGVALVLKLRLK